MMALRRTAAGLKRMLDPGRLGEALLFLAGALAMTLGLLAIRLDGLSAAERHRHLSGWAIPLGLVVYVMPVAFVIAEKRRAAGDMLFYRGTPFRVVLAGAASALAYAVTCYVALAWRFPLLIFVAAAALPWATSRALWSAGD
jgi:hypothetical protein